VPCTLTISDEEHEISSEARLALYRVAQEALTNIAKHAHPERVELRLAYEPSITRLVVEDFATANGTRPPPTRDGGYGLTRHARTRRAARRHPHHRDHLGRLPRRAGRARMTLPISVVIADDQRVVREGLACGNFSPGRRSWSSPPTQTTKR